MHHLSVFSRISTKGIFSLKSVVPFLPAGVSNLSLVITSNCPTKVQKDDEANFIFSTFELKVTYTKHWQSEQATAITKKRIFIFKGNKARFENSLAMSWWFYLWGSVLAVVGFLAYLFYQGYKKISAKPMEGIFMIACTKCFV